MTGAESDRGEDGMVTAETAVVLPFLVAVALVLVWVVSLGIAQVHLVDASREAARMSARGDDASKVRSTAEKMAPEGARIRIERQGSATTVRISLEEGLSMPLLDRIPPVRLHAEAVSANEGPAGGRSPAGESP
ncbi:MAG: TadE family type IV pilus minor pilin [Nocardioidaceae bacterium]